MESERGWTHVDWAHGPCTLLWLRLDAAWHIVGGAATALGAGAARLASAYVLGGSVMQNLWTNQGVGLIGPVGVPTVLAIIVITFLRTKARIVQT